MAPICGTPLALRTNPEIEPGRVPSPHRKRQAQRTHEATRAYGASNHHLKRETKPSDYSTAKVAEGSTVCLEMLSFTLI